MKTITLILLLLTCLTAAAADTLLCFTASWCGPCRQFKADLADDPTLVGDRQVVNVDVETQRDQVRRYRVRSMPTFILLHDDGHELRRTTGYTGPQALKAWMDGGRH